MTVQTAETAKAADRGKYSPGQPQMPTRTLAADQLEPPRFESEPIGAPLDTTDDRPSGWQAASDSNLRWDSSTYSDRGAVASFGKVLPISDSICGKILPDSGNTRSLTPGTVRFEWGKMEVKWAHPAHAGVFDIVNMETEYRRQAGSAARRRRYLLSVAEDAFHFQIHD